MQVIYNEGVIVSPEIEVEFEGDLMTPYSITMPTCYFSTNDDDPVQIMVRYLKLS